VSDDDMALMGAAGMSIVHNAISNQKLGAGIAPLRRLLDAGVTVGLGTDGASSNDTLRILDVMRVAALIHSASGPDYAQWLSAADILRAATIDGARTAMLETETGSLEVGKKADLIMLRMDGLDYVALNDPAKHVVYCENGSSLETVMVAGEIVAKDRRLTRINEDAVLAEIRETVPAWLAEHAELERRNAVFEPYFAEIHRRATLQDIGIDRYAGDASAWPGANRT
jgi:5-methylthioadenosine/S-adenosylhomocysteine deaminase